jgi:osmotically-inducible protein OsmY
MANDRWDNDDIYRPRRYGNDLEYERDFWRQRRERESGGRASAQDERSTHPTRRYSSLPILGLDYGNPRRYPDRDRFQRERQEMGGQGYRGRDDWGEQTYGEDWNTRRSFGRNYGDEWSRRDYGGRGYGRDYGRDYASRDYGSDWDRRDAGSEWGSRDEGERGWWDRTKDEVRSWFGDTEAEYRRQADHRGRGPRGYTRSDERIREDVNDWLMEDRYIDASDIEVTVVAGEVTLTGTVESRDTMWRAENLAADVLGVKDVHNRLRTRSRQSYGTTPSESAGTASSQTSAAATGTSATNLSNTPRH